MTVDFTEQIATGELPSDFGRCLPKCVAHMLDCEESSIPHFTTETSNWLYKMSKWLDCNHNVVVVDFEISGATCIPDNSVCIACGYFDGSDVMHAIVVRTKSIESNNGTDTEFHIEHDPDIKGESGNFNPKRLMFLIPSSTG